MGNLSLHILHICKEIVSIMALGTNLSGKAKNVDNPEKSESIEKEEILDKPQQREQLDVQEEEIVAKSQYCVFKAGSEEYAIPIEVVKEVVKYSPPAPIPQMPNYILGMSNVRGNIYGVMDLECYFKGVALDSSRNYLLVLDDDTYKMAISIGEVPNSLMVNEDEVEQLNTSSFKSVIGQKFLQGIIKLDNAMIVLLNIKDMIASEDFTSFKD